MQQEKCFVTGKQLNKNELASAASMRKNLVDFIRKDFPDFSESSFISLGALQNYRKKYLESLIESEMGDLDRIEREVVDAISHHEIVSENVNQSDEEALTFGQRLADTVATFGGSWAFIIIFGITLLSWITLNSLILGKYAFDPYPYILLNLILSCLAALQAPVIMMSQNRKETKDRLRGEYDYKVNLKAELEIRLLHEKLDHLMLSQAQKIMELQQLQMDYLGEMVTHSRANKTKGGKHES